MRIYTVHELPGAPLDGAGIVLVKEGFSFPAFALSWVWLIYHRMWVALAIWIGLTVTLSYLAQFAFGAGAAMAVSLALNFMLGAEGNDIRRWTLARKSYREAGIAAGATLEEAERNFFAKWDRPLVVEEVRPVTAPVWPRRPQPAQTESGVFGLFPDAGPRPGH
ncbi:MAG: hypothetical protein C0454_16830 [Parvibaculum sp.]|jgi:hypothetical protein|nr:hypothetical protein [Parvibaculum sp.]